MPDARAATVVLPGEGEVIHAAGDRYRFLATRETTDGKYAIWEATVPPGGGPPPHRHSREEEGFYVVEGEVVVYAGDRRVVATPGSFVNMPVGLAHRFRNESDRPAKMLILVAPGGMEEMFRETGTPAAAGDPVPPLGDDEKRRIGATAPRYGIEILAPAH